MEQGQGMLLRRYGDGARRFAVMGVGGVFGALLLFGSHSRLFPRASPRTICANPTLTSPPFASFSPRLCRVVFLERTMSEARARRARQLVQVVCAEV